MLQPREYVNKSKLVPVPGMQIDDLIEAIQLDQIRITDHATDEAEDDELRLDEILQSVFCGEIIEHYPREKPYPRCLVYGRSDRQEPPDPTRWLNWRNRL